MTLMADKIQLKRELMNRMMGRRNSEWNGELERHKYSWESNQYKG